MASKPAIDKYVARMRVHHARLYGTGAGNHAAFSATTQPASPVAPARQLTATAPPSATPASTPPTTPTSAPAAAPAPGAATGQTSPAQTHDQPPPFASTDKDLDVQKLAIGVLQGLVKTHVGIAYIDYTGALASVASKWSTKIAKDEKENASMTKLVIAIAFLPLGPLAGAALAGVGPSVVTELSIAKLSPEQYSR